MCIQGHEANPRRAEHVYGAPPRLRLVVGVPMELMNERFDFMPEGPGPKSLFAFDLTPTLVLEITKRDDMPANNALLRALQKIQLSPECWRTVERYLGCLWSEDYALCSYFKDYLRSADWRMLWRGFHRWRSTAGV